MHEMLQTAENCSCWFITCRYKEAATDFLKLNPDSKVGSPGFHQVLSSFLGMDPLASPCILKGLNTGVVLHHLERQRASPTFSSALKISSMLALVDNFLFANKGYVGDQEWVTLLSWKHPELFHHLPCNFNYQQPHPNFPRDQDPKWTPYYHCDGEILILHRPWTLDN